MSDVDDLSGRYVTEAVESGVFDADGDCLGHVGLFDLDDVDLPDALEISRSLPGVVALLRSSGSSYHVWSLEVRPLGEWIDAATGLEEIDAEHVSLSERRECGVLRIDSKVSTETGDVETEAPRLLGTTRNETDGPLSTPHARVLREEHGAAVDPSRGSWIGESVERRVYMADIGGR